jgi:hypothetical protein
VTTLGRQLVERLLHRLNVIEAQQPGQTLWIRYLRRHIRLYSKEGVVDLTEQGLSRATLADRLVLRDAWEHLKGDLLE